jgi:uncharacterized protein YbaR (Trm112 family)
MTSQMLAEPLLKILVCPVCHHPVTPGPEAIRHAWLHCNGCGRYYPVQDGIPVMLEHRATTEPPAA